MRSRFGAWAAALALVVGSSANAEIYTMFTKPTALASTANSALGLKLNLSNIITVPSGNATGTLTNGFMQGNLTGSATVDMKLNASDSGTLYITGSSFSLSAINVTQSGRIALIFPYSIQMSATTIGVQMTAGPINVTNGNFSINSSTPGSLTLNSGLLNYNIVISSLGVNEVGAINLATDPITVDFSSLGAVTIPGTADDSKLKGSDQTSYDGHSGSAGITGISTIDDDGSELFVNFNGIYIYSALDLNGTSLPITITLAGGVSVGVPEAGSLILVGAVGTVGSLGLFIRRRRRSA